jgi:replicative DNA helicase
MVFNQNLEKSVLSHLLYCEDKSLISKIESRDFYFSAYQEIYNALYSLYIKHRPIDTQLLLEELDGRYEEELIDISSTVAIASIDEYIQELKNIRKKREIVDFSNQLKDKIDELDVDQAKERLYSQIESLFDDKKLIDIGLLSDVVASDIEFVLTGWLPIPKRTVTLFSAPGGSGKSWAVIQLTLRYIIENPDKKAFLWLSEDPKELSKKRAFIIAHQILAIDKGVDKDRVFERIAISDTPAIQMLQEARRVEINKKFYELKELLKDYELIVFDPLSAFFGVEENSNSNARMFMQLFTDWANKNNKIIIFLHHSTKHSTTARGASAFVDAVRLVYEIDNDKDDKNSKIFKVTKDNYGAKKHLKESNVKREILADMKNLAIRV